MPNPDPSPSYWELAAAFRVWICFQLVLTALLVTDLKINCVVRAEANKHWYGNASKIYLAFAVPLQLIVIEPIADRYCEERTR